MSTAPAFDSSRWLAWFFVTVWGSGYLATKVGLQYAPPFTFLSLRFAFGMLLLVPLGTAGAPRLAARAALGHVIVAGLLMHAVNLGGSHYAQYLGMSAGITALVLALQPLATATVAAPLAGERLRAPQWIGVLLGLAGVALVVWHKIDMRAMSARALTRSSIALAVDHRRHAVSARLLPGGRSARRRRRPVCREFRCLLPPLALAGRRLPRGVDLAAGRAHRLSGGDALRFSRSMRCTR